MRGLVIASARSGEGKTTVTLGVLAALRRRGLDVVSAKSGPDYIDAQFLAAATGRACRNLDAWAMSAGRLRRRAAEGGGLLVVEGAMGLHDGALAQGGATGSTAELAAILGLPTALVLDVAGQAQSAAAVALGMARFRSAPVIAGVLLNRVGSSRHERILRRAMAECGLPVFGALPSCDELRLPSRHLGLVQAGEHADLDLFLERAASWIESHVDLDAMLGKSGTVTGGPDPPGLPPPGQRVAVARDDAFSFAYAHLLSSWRHSGAELHFFSPLRDEGPDPAADGVYLPGGYPELHAGRLAGAGRFRQGMRSAALRGARIYGECGGYMALGRALRDADGVAHAMLGLLPLTASMQAPKLHLGYRRLTPLGDSLWRGTTLMAHEFHYATAAPLARGVPPLFAAEDSEGRALAPMGMRVGGVMGSFAHVIDRA